METLPSRVGNCVPPGAGSPPTAPDTTGLTGALQPFLEACSCSLFFRTGSVLLRAPKLDLHVLEKLSIILQKLSKIKKGFLIYDLSYQKLAHCDHLDFCFLHWLHCDY